LFQRSSGASLAEVRIVDAKSFGKSGIDVIHKNSSNVDWILFEVVKRADCVEERRIVDLRRKALMIAVLVDVALEDMVEHVVRLERVSRDKHLKKLLMDSCRGKLDDLILQVAISHRAFGSARGQVEAWREEVVRSVLMGGIKDIAPDGLDSQSTQICGTSKCGEAIRIACSISQVGGVLGKLNIIFPLSVVFGAGSIRFKSA
jgi:hypothetical protein